MTGNEDLKQTIAVSQSVRMEILRRLYLARVKNPANPWVWRRDLEQIAGKAIGFELDYLKERGDVAEDGPKYRITAAGIDLVEAST